MKWVLIILLNVLSIELVSSQQWTSIQGTDYNPPFGFVFGGNGWRPGNKQFKVNPYDNSIWIAFDTLAHGFDANGDYFRYSSVNEPLFNSNTNFSTILEFEFTPSKTFLIDIWNGVLEYNGTSWNQLATGFEANFISSDGDSIWVAYQGGNPYLMWKNDVPSSGTFTASERMVSRKGEVWINSGYDDGVLARLVNEFPIIYSPDTSILMDNVNYDFKFARHTDTLYTAGSLGLSLAYQGTFIDSICPANSINMPASSIREFEFDNNNDIWALFGTSVGQHTHIAKYNQQTNDWTNIYDNSNSSIYWDGRVSIECDSAGNLYVLDNYYLHVLKINNWPQWVGVHEAQDINQLFYPNPSNGEFSIKLSSEVQCDKIVVTDISGRNIFTSEFNPDVRLNVPSGTYMINLISNDIVIGSERIVIQQKSDED